MKTEYTMICKLLSLCLALWAVFGYQAAALEHQRSVAADQAAMEAVERYNETALSLMGESAQEQTEEGAYLDGVYPGTGTGFGGDIEVSAVVEGGRLVSIEAVSHPGEDEAYFAQAESVLDQMVRQQTWEVDTVSGATFSSSGLIAAAQQALEQAVRR